MSPEIWQKPEVINWTQLLLDSYNKLLGKELIPRKGTKIERAKNLFFAPFVVASHGTESDPVLNYGNQKALDLWEISWQELIKMPSKKTAEPINQQERIEMLEQASKQGFIDNYRGVRITSSGKRFLIERAVVWNLIDNEGKYCGQAATFSDWNFLKDK